MAHICYCCMLVYATYHLLTAKCIILYMQTLQSEEISKTKNTLAQLEPGRLPFDIFTEVCRLTVTPVLEVVCFRRDDMDKIEVALLKRSADDPNWPNMYHVPGAVITPTDIDAGLEGVADRICTEKLSIKGVSKPKFIMNKLCKVKRGVELAVVFAVETEDEIAGVQLYDVNALPDNLIEGHGAFIAQAIKSFSDK